MAPRASVNKKRRGATPLKAQSAQGGLLYKLRASLQSLTRWLGMLVWPAGLAVFVATLWFGAEHVMTAMDQPLKAVHIEGRLEHTSEQVLLDWAETELQATYMQLDLDAIKARLQTHPWVAQAQVRRQWPAQLSIEVEEQVPFARWGEEQLMTAAGVIFSPEKNYASYRLPQLWGANEATAELLASYPRFVNLADKLGMELLALNKNQRGSWSLELGTQLKESELLGVQSQTIKLKLGRAEIAAKLQRFEQLYERVLHQHIQHIAAIDLRYTHGVAVEWQSGVQAEIKNETS